MYEKTELKRQIKNLEEALKFLDERMTKLEELTNLRKKIGEGIFELKNQSKRETEKIDLLTKKIKELNETTQEGIQVIMKRIDRIERSMMGGLT